MGFKLFILCLALLVVAASASSICKCRSAEEKILQDSPASDSAAKYRLKLKTDDGKEFDEEVKIDTQKGTETFHVPKTSPDNEEADIVLDFNKNYMMVRMPDAKACFLSQSTENAPKPADLKRLLDAGLTITPNRPELKFKVVGTLDDNARSDLNDEMTDLCAKIPIHVVVKIDRAPTDQSSDNAPVKVIKRTRRDTCHVTCSYEERRRCFLFFCSTYYKRVCQTHCH